MANMGFTFKGKHSMDLGVIVKSVSKSILPSLEHQSTPLKYGGWHNNIKVAPREITVAIYLDGVSFYSYEEKVREIAGWLYSETPQPLFFDEESDRYYMAVVDGDTAIEQILWYGEAEITFMCFDPFAIATRDTITKGTESKKEIYYGGNAKTFPIVTLRYNSTIDKPWFSIGDRVLGIQGTHSGSSTFVINCDTGLITKDGKLATTLLALNSEYPYLNMGVQQFETNASNWEIAYRAKYL